MTIALCIISGLMFVASVISEIQRRRLIAKTEKNDLRQIGAL